MLLLVSRFRTAPKPEWVINNDDPLPFVSGPLLCFKDKASPPKGGEKAEAPPFRGSASTTPPMAGGDDKRTPGSSSPSSRWRKPGARYGPGLEKRSSECQKEGPCSSSPSVWSKKAQQQMVTPVQQSKSEGSLPQTVTQVQPLKSVDSPPQMVTPVQPSEFVDSLCQMVGSVQISDSLDSRSTSCASESVVGSGPGAAPFDICRGVSKCSVEVKPSLLDINREKRRAKELAKSPNALQHLRPGMVLLKNFLKPDDQVKIIKQCRELGVGTGGFYQPCYKDGAKLSLRMMCLGKNWNPDSSSYVDRRPFDGAQPPKIPEELTKFIKDAIDAAHAFVKQSGGQGTSNPLKVIPPISPDICIVNFYTTAGKLGLHQDKDETKNSLAKNLPVVSFSLGDTAEFLYGDARDEAKASKIKLESGDVLIFGGQSRHIFHGVSTITPKTAPTYVTEEAKLRPGRLNLTFRQY
ncbi:hypothetical protein ACQ4PT_059167 [Festuca glaucescens]